MITKGIIIGGEHGKLLIREKSDANLQIGELLVAISNNKRILIQVTDLTFGSQISQQNLELISGMKLEEHEEITFMDQDLRHYNVAVAKNILTITANKVTVSKDLPKFFSEVREIENQDFDFLTKPEHPITIGHIRSGSKNLDIPITLPGKDVLTHHILIPATTGKGKSNLTKYLLWNMVPQEFTGSLILDPHDEYYGRNNLGLKDYPDQNKIHYYTPNNPPPRAKTLKISINNLKPEHFNGILEFSDPQKQALYLYHRAYQDNWVKAILEEKEVSADFKQETLAVVKRKIMATLDISIHNQEIFCNGIFDTSMGESTINDICNALEQAHTVIIDSSSLAGPIELLTGSIMVTEIFSRYKYHKRKGKKPPIIAIVLEEAPRVLGKAALERGTNIFSAIAREGRKFGIGLIAITQLPSLIPREILANMNTKIILGIEMQPERQAIIESASQDLSADSRNIASLDKGEAIVSSNFSRFAAPIKIPYFKDSIKKQATVKKTFSGINLS